MQPSLVKSNLIPEGTRLDEKVQILSKGDAVKMLDPKGKIAAVGKVVCLCSNDRLKPGRLEVGLRLVSLCELICGHDGVSILLCQLMAAARASTRMWTAALSLIN